MNDQQRIETAADNCGYSAHDMATAKASGFREAENISADRVSELEMELAALKAKQGGADERAAFEAAFENTFYSACFERHESGEYVGRGLQGAWLGWQARAALSAHSHGEQVRHMVPDFYWVEADEGSWNSPEEWAQDYYDYNGEKPESVSFSCAVELPPLEYDSFEFDADGNCISCRLVNTEATTPSAGSQKEQGE